VNSAIKVIRSIYRLAKALLGLPYVPMGILVLLALTWFSQPTDLALTATLMFAFPVSWLCRLQCEREQSFYKKLIMNSKGLKKAPKSRVPRSTVKNCPACNKTISSEDNFCPYCAIDLKRQKLQQQPNPAETAVTICPKCSNRMAGNANFCSRCGADLRSKTPIAELNNF